MKKRPAVLAALLGVALLVATWIVLKGAARHPLGSARLTTKEYFVAKACPNMTGAVTSPDARRVACILGADIEGPQRVAVDGVAQKEYEGMRYPSSLSFSPNGQRVGYWAKRAGKRLVVIDGVEGEEYEYVNYLTWSPDGRRVAYNAGRPLLKCFVVVDGAPVGPYLDVDSGPVFSPDSKRVAYVATRGRPFIVVDGREGQTYAPVDSSDVAFSPDGQRIAYVVGGGAYKHQRLVVVERVEGLEKPDKAEVVEGEVCHDIKRLVFSADSRRVAYWAEFERRRTWVVVVDGVRGKPYQVTRGQCCDLLFSPDSRRVAYVAQGPDKSVVVVDGVEGKPYDDVDFGLAFSPDSKRVAYPANRGRKHFLVDGNAESSEYDDVKVAGIFSPDGKRTAYAASFGGKWHAVVDGVPGKAYEELCGGPVFRPNSKDVAFFCGGPVFSPDSKRFAFLAKRAGKWVVVVAGVESNKEFDAYVGNGELVFDGPDLLRTLAQRGDQIFRVEVKIN
jgi:Tol biopolymer transport system component